MHDAAAGELGRPRRTLTGTTGALLPVRFPAATADLAAGLGRVRALTGGRQLRRHHLVHQRDVRLDVEQLGGQLDGAVLLARRGVDVDLDSLGCHYFSPRLIALRTITSPPVRPGMAPLISSTPFSASTLCTNRFCVVTRSLPMRPDIRVPLNTRPGVAQPPIEPGRRCTACAPWLAPWPLEAVALHGAGEALALGGAGHVDIAAVGEDLGGQLLADLELGGGGLIVEPELGEMPARVDTCGGCTARSPACSPCAG